MPVVSFDVLISCSYFYGSLDSLTLYTMRIQVTMPMNAIPDGRYLTVPAGALISSSAEQEYLGVPSDVRVLPAVVHHYSNASVVEVDVVNGTYYRFITFDRGQSFQLVNLTPPFHHLFMSPPSNDDFDDDDRGLYIDASSPYYPIWCPALGLYINIPKFISCAAAA